jgi:hypothetical protein
MTLKEFFEGLNIVKNFDSVRTFNNAIETVDESILIDSSISLISGHEYFSAFDLIFKTMPADAPDSYRLWVGSEGVTDTITHSFLTDEKEVFMNVKTSASSRTSDLYLNLFGMTIGQSMSLETNLYFIIDLSNLSFEVTEEQVYYYYRMYRYLKDSKSFDGFTYLPKGQSKYDVAYVNKTIDDPIAELNGHTLREVFEGIYSRNTGDIIPISGRAGTIAQNEDYYKWEVLSQVSSYMIDINLPLSAGDDFFLRFDIKLSESVALVMRYIYTTDGQWAQNFTANLLQNYVTTRESPNTNNGLSFGNPSATLNSQHELFNLRAVNLSKLGISPTTNMDYYYSLYQARKNITKKVLTYADIFEELNLVPLNPKDWDLITFEYISNNDGTITYTRTSNASNPYVNLLNLKLENDYYCSFILWGNNTLEYFRLAYSMTTIQTPLTPTRFSFIDTVTNSVSDISMRLNSFISNSVSTLGNVCFISLEYFDESITKEQLETMLAYYLLVKNIVIYPEIYVPIEPVGLGNRFKLLAVDDTVYGHELDFEDISFKMYFGVNFDAYKGYHAMMNMLRSNKAIIKYDWGIGPRYNDVRLLNAPKTEKDTSLLIISKFYFKRLNPFYELIEVSDEEDMKNESDLDSPVKLDLTVSNTTVSIKLLDAASGVQKEISFDFTGVSTPFNLTIDPETKKLLIDDMTDAYDYADHTKDSFIYLPGDSEIYSINITGAAVNKITYKKWVIS